MQRPWILIDVHYLCHRAFHSTGGLSHGNQATGVLYGFFRDLMNFKQILGSDRFVFCFDMGISHRAGILPSYKSTRKEKFKEMDSNEREAYEDLAVQIKMLRNDLLYRLGFSNIFWCDNYEADDIIGSLCKFTLRKKSSAVIVTGDTDFYQLIRHKPKISVYHPSKGRIVDKKLFQALWNIRPYQWIDVKCIAGCSTDDIPGVKGVKEKTAAKYIRKQLSTSSVAFQAITKNEKRIQSNRELVSLPFGGEEIQDIYGNSFELHENQVKQKKWQRVMKEFGMLSLLRSF